MTSGPYRKPSRCSEGLMRIRQALDEIDGIIEQLSEAHARAFHPSVNMWDAMRDAMTHREALLDKLIELDKAGVL